MFDLNFLTDFLLFARELFPLLIFKMQRMKFKAINCSLSLFAAEFRHKQFIRQNLSHDYDMVNTPQDNGKLVWFVREMVMKKYPMPNLPKL
jgi:hypothetical protein